MPLSLIVAVAENQVIGREGQLPWRLSADLRRFKRLTMGHRIVMGRKTYESIGRALPGRTSIVLTRQADFQAAEGVLVADSLEAALREAGDDEVFVIGGAGVYRESLPRATRVYLTRVHADVEGDTFFPRLDPQTWRLVEQHPHPADEKNDFAHTFQVYERR